MITVPSITVIALTVFEPLKDESLFSQVAVDEFGAVCWPNGADLAPDALHDRLSRARVA